MKKKRIRYSQEIENSGKSMRYLSRRQQRILSTRIKIQEVINDDGFLDGLEF
jgi:hypothetical protein